LLFSREISDNFAEKILTFNVKNLSFGSQILILVRDKQNISLPLKDRWSALD